MAYLFNKTQTEYNDLFKRICMYLKGMRKLHDTADLLNETGLIDGVKTLRGEVVTEFDVEADSYVRSSLLETLDALETQLDSLGDALQSEFESEFCVQYLGDFMEVLEETVEDPLEEQDGNGNVTITYKGLIGLLRDHMLNNLTILLDGGSQTSNWHLRGVVKGTNTDANGIMYAKLTDAAGTRTVAVYKDIACANKVAEGTNVGDGTVTLSEENSSGIEGQVDIVYAIDDLDIQLSPQSVDANTIAFEMTEEDNFFADPDNVGEALFSTEGAEELVKEGKLLVECVSAALGRETCKVSNELGDEAARYAYMHANFKSSDLFVYFKMDRIYDITNPDAAGVAPTNMDLNGESSTNCPAGIYYCTATKVGTVITIDLYSDSARTSKVATGTRDGAGTLTFSAVNSSGLTGSCTIAGAEDGDFTIDLNGLAIGDKWWVEVTNDEAGEIQTEFRPFKVPLPSDTAGNETIVDTYMDDVEP